QALSLADKPPYPGHLRIASFRCGARPLSASGEARHAIPVRPGERAKRARGGPVANRYAVQLRSVHIRISADRRVGSFFTGTAPRAVARRGVAGDRFSRILRLRRPLSPPAADSLVDCLQFLHRSDAVGKPKSWAFGNRYRWRSLAAWILQICGVFDRDPQRSGRHRLAEAEYRSADRHLVFHIYADRLSGRRLPWRGARIRTIPL